MKALQAVEQVESAYFSEEDVTAIHTALIEKGLIEPDQGEATADPVFFIKALDQLIDGLIAEIVEYPEEMLFRTDGGCFGRDFQRATDAIKARGMSKEELRALR
jgi:hypothetical protein